MDAVECYVNEPGKEPTKESGCVYCGYSSVFLERGAMFQRLCLNNYVIAFKDNIRINELDKCYVAEIGQEASICKTDLCNMYCAGKAPVSTSTEQPPSSSSSPSTLPSTSSSSSIIPSTTPSTTTKLLSKTTTTPQPTTAFPKITTTKINTENGGSLTANFLSVFGLLLISFFIFY
uniref:Uncharacterized protein n=1 Tax=Panagrolaimus davidi TaxID=227884 RepID=A0A914PWW8_9BILA